MPHITIEYTGNLCGFEPVQVLTGVNRACLDSGLFSEPDIKSRAVAVDCFQVGVDNTPRAFIHARIALLEGRSERERQALSDSVLAALTSGVAPVGGMEIQISVETVELHRASYAKALLSG